MSIILHVHEVLQLCLKWSWIPIIFALLLMVLSIPRQRYRHFFDCNGFRDYLGKLPRYIGSKKASPYLKKICFRSRIPLEDWNKLLPSVEQFENHRVYKAEKPIDKIRETDIFLIMQELPNKILWNDCNLLEEESKFAIGEGYE